MPEHIEDDPPSREVADAETTNGIDKGVVLVAMKRLEAAIIRLTHGFARVDKFAKRTRWIAVASVVAVVLAISGGALAAFAKSDSGEANDKASRSQEYQVANCKAGNEYRKDNKDLWEYLIKLNLSNPDPQATAAQKKLQAKLIKKFQAKVDETYAPRDCTKVKDGVSAPTTPKPTATPAP